MPALARILPGSVHVLVLVLLAVAILDPLRSDNSPLAVLPAAAGFGAVYLVGLRLSRDTRAAAGWGALLSLTWVALVLATPAGVWLAFPLFFLAAHILPGRLAVPVVAGITTVAVLGFAWHQGWSVGGVLGPVLGAVVALATVAGLRSVDAASRLRGVQGERDRLAHEIHDTLAQGLNSIHLLLAAADRLLDDDPTRARPLIRQASEVAARDLEETRRFVRALAPTGLATHTLTEALTRVAAQSTPPASVSVTGEPFDLPPGHDVALLRIAQESLTNITRHSGADRAGLTLTYLGDEVALDVVDNGSGIGISGGLNDSRSGFGMTSMRQRARTLGGDVTVESAPGEGTAVRAVLPVPQT